MRCGELLEGDAAPAVAREQRFFVAQLRCGFWQPCALRGSFRQDASQASSSCVTGLLTRSEGPRVAPRERSKAPQTKL